MNKVFRGRIVALAVGALAAQLSNGAGVTSQPSTPVTLEDVIRRVERLEDENAALRRELAALKSRPTTAPDALKDEKDRAAMAKFIRSVGPYFKELRTMKARLETGITRREYADKLAAMVEAYALVDVPDGDQELADLLRRPLDLYRNGGDQWTKEIEYFDLVSKSAGTEATYWIDASKRAREARRKAWEEATKITELAVAAINKGGVDFDSGTVAK
jgi:cell division septum initiation protein DivIVA